MSSTISSFLTIPDQLCVVIGVITQPSIEELKSLRWTMQTYNYESDAQYVNQNFFQQHNSKTPLIWKLRCLISILTMVLIEESFYMCCDLFFFLMMLKSFHNSLYSNKINFNLHVLLILTIQFPYHTLKRVTAPLYETFFELWI
jgi:hypothetical protein